MRHDHKPLERPLVILGGYRAPYHVQVRVLTGRMVSMTSGVRSDALGVSFFFDGSLEESADWAVTIIERQWPSDDPDWTVEVDAIGISMGGLVGRHAWASDLRTDGTHRKRLRLKRLFTVGTPHRGACLADRLTIDKPTREMRAGSGFLRALDAADADRDYELICYARTNDEIVGATRSSPEGMNPYWVHGPWLFSHQTIARDWRIAVDIARRLRGEAPFALETSAPPHD